MWYCDVIDNKELQDHQREGSQLDPGEKRGGGGVKTEVVIRRETKKGD